MLKKSFFLKHRLKNSNCEVRLAVINELSGNEDELFFETALNDPADAVRLAAVKRLDRIDLLEKLAEQEKNQEISGYLKIKMNQLYAARIIASGRLDECKPLLEKINDGRTLAELAVSAMDDEIIRAAASRLEAYDDILYFFRKSAQPEICRELLERIDCRELLEQIAADAVNQEIREAAQAALAPEDAGEPVQTAPVPAITDELRELLDAKAELCLKIEQFAAEFTERDVTEFENLQKQWESMEPAPLSYQEILDKKFKKACQSFAEAQKEYELRQAARKEKLNRLEHLYVAIVKLTESEAGIEERNHSATAIIREWNKISDEIEVDGEMLERFNADVDKIHAELKLHQERQKQETAALESCCLEMEQIAENAHPEDFRDRHKELKELVFAKHELADEIIEPLIKRFKKSEHVFIRKLHEFFQAQDFSRWEHYTLKLDLCAAAEKLCYEQDIRTISRKLKELHLKWQEIGAVPKEKAEELWNRFKPVCDILRQRCADYYRQLDEQKEENLKVKTTLCDEAESLQNVDEWKNAAARIKEMQQQWRDTGPAPTAQDRVLYIRFREACNNYFTRRKEHYEKLHEDRQSCAEAKQQLCEQAEKLAGLPTGEALREAKRLRAEWQQASFAGRAEQKLHNHFNELLDALYSGLRNEREANLQIRQQVCQEMATILENLDASGDRLAENRECFNALRKKWNDTGPIPRNEEKSLMDRFDELCRAIYDRMTEISSNAEARLRRNYLKLEQLIGQVLACPAGEFDDARLLQWNAAWDDAAQISPEHLDSAEKIFREAVDAVSTDNRKEVNRLLDALLNNLKQKESICMELEKIADIEPPENHHEKTGISLAEELSLAIQNNFAGSQTEMSRKEKIERATRLDKEWLLGGPVPADNSEMLFQRYCRARKALFKN